MKTFSKIIIGLTLLICTSSSVFATSLPQLPQEEAHAKSLEEVKAMTKDFYMKNPAEIPKVKAVIEDTMAQKDITEENKASLQKSLDFLGEISNTLAAQQNADAQSNGTGMTLPQGTATDFDLSESTFNVTKVLTLDSSEQPKKYFSDTKNSPLVSFVITIMDFAITIMGSIAVILFIAAGFMFMLANGDQQQVDKAKEVVKFAIYGLIIAALSYIIVVFVQSLFVAD